MATDPLVGMLIRVRPTTSAHADNFSRRFVVGQTLKGIVLRALPEGQTLVNFAGQQLVFDLAQPLAKGQTFLATVEQTTPMLTLKVLDDSPPPPAVLSPQQPAVSEQQQAVSLSVDALSPAQLKSYLIAKRPFGDMVATLQHYLLHSPLLRAADPALDQRLMATLRALLPQNASPPDAAGLQEQVDKSGLNYEAKVHHMLTNDAAAAQQATLTQDLKGQLLEVLQRLEQQTPAAHQREAAELRQHVQQALQNIEFHQLSNLFAHQEHQSLLLQFLHPAFPTSYTAKLYFRVDPQTKRSRQAAEHAYTLVFLLDFTALGPIRIDALVRGAHVLASINTEDKAVADFISSQAPVLTSRLYELGFHAEVRCVAQEQVTLDVDDSLTRLLVTDPSQLLDIMV